MLPLVTNVTSNRRTNGSDFDCNGADFDSDGMAVILEIMVLKGASPTRAATTVLLSVIFEASELRLSITPVSFRNSLQCSDNCYSVHI